MILLTICTRRSTRTPCLAVVVLSGAGGGGARIVLLQSLLLASKLTLAKCTSLFCKLFTIMFCKPNYKFSKYLVEYYS